MGVTPAVLAAIELGPGDVPDCCSSWVNAWFCINSCCWICMFWATAFWRKACWYTICCWTWWMIMGANSFTFSKGSILML